MNTKHKDDKTHKADKGKKGGSATLMGGATGAAIGAAVGGLAGAALANEDTRKTVQKAVGNVSELASQAVDTLSENAENMQDAKDTMVSKMKPSKK